MDDPQFPYGLVLVALGFLLPVAVVWILVAFPGPVPARPDPVLVEVMDAETDGPALRKFDLDADPDWTIVDVLCLEEVPCPCEVHPRYPGYYVHTINCIPRPETPGRWRVEVCYHFQHVRPGPVG